METTGSLAEIGDKSIELKASTSAEDAKASLIPELAKGSASVDELAAGGGGPSGPQGGSLLIGFQPGGSVPHLQKFGKVHNEKMPIVKMLMRKALAILML